MLIAILMPLLLHAAKLPDTPPDYEFTVDHVTYKSTIHVNLTRLKLNTMQYMRFLKILPLYMLQ